MGRYADWSDVFAFTIEVSAIAVERTFEFQNHIRYGSFSSSTCAVAASGRMALPIRRLSSVDRMPPPSPPATRASLRYASAKIGIRSR